MNHPTASSGSFDGAEVYVGIDIHLKQWVVSLRSAGIDLKTFSRTPSSEELAEHLKRHYPGVAVANRHFPTLTREKLRYRSVEADS
jgi:hypothetical protein